MAGIRVEGADALQRKLGTASERLRAAIAGGLVEIGKGVEKKLKDAARTSLSVRSGSLLRSIGYAATETSVEVGVIRPESGKVLAYARKQDIGGVILPKGQFLVFPKAGNPYLTKAGVGGINFGSLSKEEQNRTRGQWAFVRSVFIPRSGWFSDTIVDALPVAQRIVRARIQRVLGEAGEAG